MVGKNKGLGPLVRTLRRSYFRIRSPASGMAAPIAGGSLSVAPGPCSSNGDAAAALSEAFAAMLPLPPPVAKTEPTSTAPATAAGAEEPKPSSSTAEGEDPGLGPGARNSQWRLKFLSKVGIQEKEGMKEGRTGAKEAPPDVGRGLPSLVPPSEHTGDEQPVEVVAVRQASARRSSDDIRLGYIKKLEHSRAFIPQLNRPKSSQTVTIFDWDDTLLCTSHLEMVQRQYGAIPAQVREQLASLERIVQTLLRQASKMGKVFIITNASEGWVQHSSSLCMPGLAEDLPNVEIISARGAFEAAFPGDSHAWKMHAFLQVCDHAQRTPCGSSTDHSFWPRVQVQNKLQLEAVTNLVSVGDSHIEMDAVHLLGRSFAHALVKTVKLWERPTPYELQKQLEVVADKLPDIYRTGTTLNIWLERETAQAS